MFSMFRAIFLSLCLLLLTAHYGYGQQKSIWETPAKTQEKIGKQTGKSVSAVKQWKNHLQQWGLDTNYRHALFIGGRLYTNGWGAEIIYQQPVGDAYERRKGKHAGQRKFYRLGFSEVTHEKQIKQQSENKSFPGLGNTTPFIFGKINNLYLLQLGYGREQVLLPGILEGNISLSFRYSAGISLAMLKPYYNRLIYVDYTKEPIAVWLQEEKYSDANKDLFLNRDLVFGAAKWSKGLGEIDYAPGLFLEGAFGIEPAKGKNFVQLVTIGGQFSAYSQKLPIMADRKAYPYMASFFVGLGLGKRW